MEENCISCESPKAPQVSSELTRLLNGVDDLLNYIEQLRSSISPVLKLVKFPEDDIKEDISNLVPLAENIHDISNKISLANAMLSWMLKNLEL